jgi:hypothetical protein
MGGIGKRAMVINIEQKKIIKRKIERSKCTKAIKCIDTDFMDVAPVRSVAACELLECYTDRARTCRFALPFGSTYFCRCPVRAYLFRELNI